MDDPQLTFNDLVANTDDWERVVKPAYAEHKMALRYGVFGTPKNVIHNTLVPDTESTWGIDEWKTKIEFSQSRITFVTYILIQSDSFRLVGVFTQHVL